MPLWLRQIRLPQPSSVCAAYHNLSVCFSDTGTRTEFNATSGTIYATLGDYPYSLSIKGESYYAPPKDYSYIGFNVGDEGAGFYFNTPQNYLQFPAADKNDRFAVCPTVIYTPGDFVPTLLFRDSGAKKNATCADVKVKAVF